MAIYAVSDDVSRIFVSSSRGLFFEASLYPFVSFKAAPKVQERFVKSIKALIEESSFRRPHGGALARVQHKDVLLNAGTRKTTAQVLLEGRCIRYALRQVQADKPAVGHIDLDLLHEPALRAH